MGAAWSRSLPLSTGQGDERHLTAFRDREQAFEVQYAREEELKFKARARRNKLLGLWAAEKMGLKGDEANEYARAVVFADLVHAGDADLTRKILEDLAAKGVKVPEADVLSSMGSLMAIAAAQVRTEA